MTQLVEFSKLKPSDKVKVIIGQYGISSPTYSTYTKSQLEQLAKLHSWTIPNLVYAA